MPKKGKNSNFSSRSHFEEAIDRAESAQQRAERRRGAEALACYEQAAALYQQALHLAHTPGTPPPASKVADCRFSLAETLQNWAETLLQATAALPDANLSRSQERQAQSQARSLFEEAAKQYNEVKDTPEAPPASLRVDAAVCCGNTLAAWAQLVADPGEAGALLTHAQRCYQAALLKEEDAMTWSNFADVLVQHGELLCKHGEQEQGSAMFEQSQEAYAKACGLSSTENGDDLPGLLLNWGAGSLAAASHAQDPQTALKLLEEAVIRFRESISFDRGDVAPHNGLGDALVAKAEWLQRGGDVASAATALQGALGDGYGAALRIQSTNSDALVGVAEASGAQARLAASHGDSAGAAAAWAAAIDAYSRALLRPEALGDLAQRSDVRYNLACCLVGAGRLEDAAVLVKELVQSGSVDAAEVQTDAELAPILGML